MKALIRLRNGKYYASKVFAILNNKIEDKWEAGYSFQYVVFDEKNENLIVQNEYEQNTKHINTLLLIYDTDTSDMELDKNGLGKVSFISDEELNNIIDNNIRPNVINDCKKHIISYEGEYLEIKTARDIENLMCAAGGFHDGYISKIEKKPSGELVVLFDGLWGCSIEMNFASDVEYQNERSIEEGNAWWFGSTMVIDKGIIYFVDEDSYEIGNLLDDYLTWFKSKTIKYRIIPK